MNHFKSNRWDDKAVDHAHRVTRKAKAYALRNDRLMPVRAFFGVAALESLSTFLIAIMVLPYLIILGPLMVYAVTILLGISFGSLFDIVLRVAGDKRNSSYKIMSAMLPFIVFVNVILGFWSISAGFGESFSIALVYGLSIALPHYWSALISRK